MGSGASCTERLSTPLDERLRTMLILRAYNCRPRDWTMKDQFDAVSESGLLTKDNIREALRLSECPRIETILDHCLLQRLYVSADHSTASIPVAELIDFLEVGSYKVPHYTQNSWGGSSQQPPLPLSTKPASKQPIDLLATRREEIPGPPSCVISPKNNSDDSSASGVDVPFGDDGGKLMSPRIVPLTSKWKIIRSKAAEPKKTRARSGMREEWKGMSGQNDSSSLDASKTREPSGKHMAEDRLGERENCAIDLSAEGGCCTTLVKHLGSVLGLRNKNVYRRPGPCQPVWRKRETLIQERIVQYTTLDEEGTIQELYETEKSQTEVLHMECKRTGEFAHRESMHYESGEAFNGEVVLEEAGVEHYVHLRSIDDEYEHLESTLPPRARPGGMGSVPAGEGAGNAEDEEIGGTNDGVDCSSGSLGEGGRGEQGRESNGNRARGQKARDGAADATRDGQDSSAQQQHTNFNCDNGNQREASSPFIPPKQTACGQSGTVGSASYGGPDERAGNGRRYPSPSSPSPHHYRSPSCSPRLSPRPARSPYRQEGVGARESSDRGEKWRWQNRQEPEDASMGATGQEFGDEKCERGRNTMQGGVGDIEGNLFTTLSEERKEEIPTKAWVLESREKPPMATSMPREFENINVDTNGTNRGRASEGIPPDLWYQSTKTGELYAGPGSGVQAPWFAPPTGTLVGFDSDAGPGSVERGDTEGPSSGGSGGTVLFFDNGSLEGGDGEDDGTVGEGWQQAESGSCLGGLDFSFPEDNTSTAFAVDKEAGVPLKQSSNLSTNRRTAPGVSGHGESDDDISHFVDGLRSDIPPAAWSVEVQEEGSHLAGDADDKESGTEASDGGMEEISHVGKDRSPAAPTLFHSHVCGGAVLPPKDGHEGNLEHMGVTGIVNILKFTGHGVAA